jgi:predicted ATP-dependent serine protease
MSRAKRPWRRCGCARSAWAAETDVLLAAETNVEDILATVGEGKRPDLVIIDSIQTLWSDTRREPRPAR